ncbi:MAG TPA: flavodoxin domain-containing protein [Anaerolineae bacterium]|nr:flavodoxin domain-containing protein [Anaerolineae bacterium]
MKAMVIYDSQFGNTAQIAQAVGRGLSEALGSRDEVSVRHIGEVQAGSLAGCAVLVVGSPTQKFRATSAIKDLLKNLPKNALRGVRTAAFDTRLAEEEINAHKMLNKFVDIFGYAAQPIDDGLQKKGGQQAALPTGFYVAGTEGPLLEGELERATAWGRQIAAGGS